MIHICPDEINAILAIWPMITHHFSIVLEWCFSKVQVVLGIVK
jgi:hypothetical protein